MSIEAQLRKRLADGESGEKLVDSLITVALRQALNGDFRFWNSIIERIDGKVADRIAGPDGITGIGLLPTGARRVLRRG